MRIHQTTNPPNHETTKPRNHTKYPNAVCSYPIHLNENGKWKRENGKFVIVRIPAASPRLRVSVSPRLRVPASPCPRVSVSPRRPFSFSPFPPFPFPHFSLRV